MASHSDSTYSTFCSTESSSKPGGGFGTGDAIHGMVVRRERPSNRRAANCSPRRQACRSTALWRFGAAGQETYSGVDIPSVDTVLMLRPTESRIIWLQQLGRGLRRHGADKRLEVIDYVGNHRVFVRHLQTLMSARDAALMRPEDATPSALRRAIAELRAAGGKAELPNGCSITYDLQAPDNLEKATGTTRKADAFLHSPARRPQALLRRPAPRQL
jgi:hypothetical protein